MVLLDERYPRGLDDLEPPCSCEENELSTLGACRLARLRCRQTTADLGEAIVMLTVTTSLGNLRSAQGAIDGGDTIPRQSYGDGEKCQPERRGPALIGLSR
jgi:hypothetical protein